jgi:hypothetical protein
MIRYSSFVTLRFLYIAHPFSSAAHQDGSPYHFPHSCVSRDSDAKKIAKKNHGFCFTFHHVARFVMIGSSRVEWL